MPLKLTSFLFFLLPFMVFSQEYSPVHNIDIVVNEEKMLYPWAAGINASHINSIDLDLDGHEDLVLFEKTTSSFLVLQNIGGEYKLAPELIKKLPKISDWMLSRDINGDGKKDILTAHALGISVYINNLPTGFDPYPSAPLLSKSTSGNINILVSREDIPAVHDVDNDGDLDIINFAYSGTTLEWHKNLQVEENLSDTLKFEKQSESWGNIRICSCSSFKDSSQPCSTDGRLKHSVGHSLLLQDIDNDNDLDLIFSDSECADLHLLINEGTADNPVFARERSNFLPVVVGLPYPAPFLVDIDQDNDDDLIIGTNNTALNNIYVNYNNSLWLFRNNWNDQGVKYEFVQSNFLQDQMLDIGQNSKAVFYDFDNDGDRDMLMGKFLDWNNNYRSGFSYYENIGSYSAPEFQLITDDLFSLSKELLYNIKPQLIDVTGDLRPELVFTGTGIYDGITRILYFKNTGIVNFHTDYILQELYSGIAYDENYLLHDIFSDGTLDLLIARSEGVVRFEFRNNQFYQVEDNFMSLPLGVYGLEIDDLDGDGNDDFIYSLHGAVKIIYDYEHQQEETDLIVLDSDDGIPMTQSPGKNIQITADRILGNNIPELIIGSNKGGLAILKSQDAIPAPFEDEFIVFSNPVNIKDNLHLQSKRNLYLYVLSTDGKVVIGPTHLPSYDIYEIDIQSLAAGMYIIHVLVDEQTSWQKKIVITK